MTGTFTQLPLSWTTAGWTSRASSGARARRASARPRSRSGAGRSRRPTASATDRALEGPAARPSAGVARRAPRPPAGKRPATGGGSGGAPPSGAGPAATRRSTAFRRRLPRESAARAPPRTPLYPPEGAGAAGAGAGATLGHGPVRAVDCRPPFLSSLVTARPDADASLSAAPPPPSGAAALAGGPASATRRCLVVPVRRRRPSADCLGAASERGKCVRDGRRGP